MLNLFARNANEALRMAIMHFRQGDARHISPRGMPTLELSTPTTTTYGMPMERVVTVVERDANPFFHFFEALWMLNGDNDVQFPAKFNSNIKNYSDNGLTFHGAYGHRWRYHFGIDQLMVIIRILREDPDSRQAVLQMWDCQADLDVESKDIPCNDLVFFKVRDNALQMLVSCRSNDALWGCYGANVVHFSMLQEVVAAMLGVKVGRYRQVSDSLHVYLESDVWEKCKGIQISGHCPYGDEQIKPFPMVNDVGSWFTDLQMFMHSARHSASATLNNPYRNQFFHHVAAPMMVVWEQYKAHRRGRECTDRIAASDWRWACDTWLKTRELQ